MRVAYGEKPMVDGNSVYCVDGADSYLLEMPEEILHPWHIVLAMEQKRMHALGLHVRYDVQCGHYIVEALPAVE